MPQDTDHYIQLGQQAILKILDAEHAATAREFEARASDRPWTGLPTRVDPDLLDPGPSEPAGGLGRSTPRYRRPVVVAGSWVWHRPIRRGLATNIAAAAQRKRLLTARHESWARDSTRYPRGLVGPAAEAAVRAAIRDSGAQGFVPVYQHQGDVPRLLGQTIPGGPLDEAAYLTVTTPAGLPATFVLPIEVKNHRQWLYPDNRDVHILLYKAAALQAAQPQAAVVPVLACRRRHDRTLRMAMALGFYAIQYWTQLVKPVVSIRQDHFTQVQFELGY